MLWVDFALQSFRDVRASAGVKLRPGYNAVVCDSVVPETVLDASLDLFFPGTLNEPGRGIVSFVGRDGGTYRVLRDFRTRHAQLFALDPARRQFITVAEGGAAEPALRAHIAFAERAVMSEIFVLSADHMPPSDTPRPPNAAARDRLKALEARIAAQGRAKLLEGELDTLTRRKLEVDDGVRARAGDPRAVQTAEAALSQFAHLSVLPDEFLVMYESARQKETQRAADLTKWRHDHEEQERLLRAAETAPLFRDTRVIGGAIAGALALGLGLAIGGSYRFIAFLDIPAFGLAAYALWHNLAHREEVDVARKRLQASDRKKHDIETRDTAFITKTNELAAMVSLNSLSEVREVLGARNAAKAALADARRAYEAREDDATLVKLREEQQVLQREIRKREAELSTMGVSGSDGGALQAEAANLRRLLGIRRPGDEGFKGTFERAVALFGGDATQTAITLTQRATQFITHLSTKKITRIEVDIDGSVAVVAAGGVVVPEALPTAARELVVLALRGALLTAIPAQHRLPLLVGPIELAGGDALMRGYLAVLAQAGLQIVQLADKAARVEGAPHITRFVAGA